MPHKQVIRYRRKEGSGRTSSRQRERIIQRSLTKWLRFEYPDKDFFNDWASGAYLTMGQNSARMTLASPNGWVDLFIPEPSRGYMGLFVELKKEGVRPYLRDGKTLSANPQIRKEAAFLVRQRKKGYMAVFACGLEPAKDIIDRYFGTVRPKNLELF